MLGVDVGSGTVESPDGEGCARDTPLVVAGGPTPAEDGDVVWGANGKYGALL